MYENSLTNPSMLSFQALASRYIDRAARTNDLAEKARLLDQAEATIDRGIEHYGSLDVRKTPWYVQQTAYYSNLFYCRSLLSAERNEMPKVRVKHLLDALELN